MRRHVLMTAVAIASITLATRASALTFTEQPSTGIETHRAGSIEYITGGVGEHERAAIRSMGNNYNLKIATALPSGNYVDGVDMTIADMNGTPILNATTQGPLFYVKLPPGQYKVIARTNGQTVERTTTVGSSAGPELALSIGSASMAAPTYTQPQPTYSQPTYNQPTYGQPTYGRTYGEPKPTREEAAGLISLYNLDPSAANAQAQVNTYEVYPDGTTRPVAPGTMRAPVESNDAVTIHIEPVPEPGVALPPPVVVSPDGEL